MFEIHFVENNFLGDLVEKMITFNTDHFTIVDFNILICLLLMYFKIHTKCAGVITCFFLWQIYALCLHFFLKEYSFHNSFFKKKFNKFEGVCLLWLSVITFMTTTILANFHKICHQSMQNLFWYICKFGYITKLLKENTNARQPMT